MSDIQYQGWSVGRSPPKLDFGISQDRLDWHKLKVMKKEHRDAEIIKRANLYAVNWGYRGMKGVDGYGISLAIYKAIKEKNTVKFEKTLQHHS